MLPRAFLSFSDGGGRLQAVHHRHLDIDEQDVERLGVERCQGLPAILDRHHTMAQFLEKKHRHVAADARVFGQQHSEPPAVSLDRCAAAARSLARRRLFLYHGPKHLQQIGR